MASIEVDVLRRVAVIRAQPDKIAFISDDIV
jgi:hypothetical protein